MKLVSKDDCFVFLSTYSTKNKTLVFNGMGRQAKEKNRSGEKQDECSRNS